MNGSVRMICSYSRSTDLISINDVNHENKQMGVWLLHKHYPFVPTVIQNVSLNLPLFLEVMRFDANLLPGLVRAFEF